VMLTDAMTPSALAAQIYDAAVGTGGLTSRLSHQGLLSVLALRAEFNGFATPQDLDFLASPASGLYDLSYYQRAIGRDDCDHEPRDRGH
jgi:hypothetical protein